ncbi:MAG: hypothetical protein ACFN4G_07900, partial [Mitsuokella sp.]
MGIIPHSIACPHNAMKLGNRHMAQHCWTELAIPRAGLRGCIRIGRDAKKKPSGAGPMAENLFLFSFFRFFVV